VDFIDTTRDEFIEEEFFSIKRRNLTISEKFHSILLTRFVMTFIEWELFHIKRRNLNVYDRHASILLTRSSDDIY
jgi:hypothetical protein